jgi:cyclic-di-GMP phosphodiesterase TipF (flagellum assembly factor)
MIRISTIFIAICMVLVAASLGLALYSMLGISGTESAIIALAALTFMILYNAVSMRLRDRTDVGGQIADLSRGTADLARQVAEFGRRLSSIEGRLVSVNAAGSDRIQSVVGEISELGALVKQLATSVASHEELLAAKTESSIEPGRAEPVRRESRAGEDDAHREQPHSSDGKVVADAAPHVAPSRADHAASRSQSQTLAAVKNAVEENRIDIYLQPMVTLPQRKVRYYEAVTRLRDDKDQILVAEDFIGIAEAAGLIGRIDNMVMLRCVQVLRRLMVRNKDVGIFCNVSATTLGNHAIFAQCLDFLDANRALAPSFVLEFKQSTFRNLGPAETDRLAALTQRGYRFSIDHVSDLRIEPRELADRGVRFIKVPASLLLDPKQMSASDIHPSDMSDLLGRFGIDLVAERIEGERSVVDLLDYDVRFGQGFLFAPPRPLRPEGAQAAGPTPQGPPQGALGKAPPTRAQDNHGASGGPLNGPGRTAPIEISAVDPAPRTTGNAALARRVAGPAA